MGFCWDYGNVLLVVSAWSHELQATEEDEQNNNKKQSKRELSLCLGIKCYKEKDIDAEVSLKWKIERISKFAKCS